VKCLRFGIERSSLGKNVTTLSYLILFRSIELGRHQLRSRRGSAGEKVAFMGQFVLRLLYSQHSASLVLAVILTWIMTLTLTQEKTEGLQSIFCQFESSVQSYSTEITSSLLRSSLCASMSVHIRPRAPLLQLKLHHLRALVRSSPELSFLIRIIGLSSGSH
jgi:hypothetical protein